MSLKTICNTLSRKPRSLDVMLQYTSPASILQPLCQLLDSWKNDEDQSELSIVAIEYPLTEVQASTSRYMTSSAPCCCLCKLSCTGMI